MARLIKAGEFVGPGELRAAQYLERELPASWCVICNKELVDPNGSTREVDFIVLAEHTVFAIEEKSWSGAIHGNENGWVLRSGESVVSPLSTVDSVSRRLAGLLRRNVPRLKEEVSGHFVFGRVLLSADDISLFVQDPRVGGRVLKLSGCVEELCRFDRLQQNVASISRFRNHIEKRLTELANRPKIPRRVGDYDILESLSGVGSIRTLRGRHSDGTDRLLKLISRPATTDEAVRQEEENARLREYNALRRLSETGRAPAVDPYFSWDQDQFWVIPLRPIEGRTLRADRTDAAPEAEKIWRVLEDAFAGLAEIHEAGIIHRALSPECIYICPDTHVAFSEFQIARIQGERTVAGRADELAPEDAYRAPECRVDPALAEPVSDVYSLSLSLLYWITGEEPDLESASLPSARSLRSDLDTDLRYLLMWLCEECLKEDERQRPTAQEVEDRIKQRRTREHSRHQARHANDAAWSANTIIADQYEVIRELGRGATAVTYLVKDILVDSHFVLKVIHNPEFVAKLARAEFRSLMELYHPNLPRVYDVRPAGSPFHLKLEYVRGSALHDVAAQYRWRVDECLSIGKQVLKALVYLAERGLIHRDVSPNNILIPDEESGSVKLIDFGLATAETERESAVGTPRYRAPEIDRGGQWTASCDLYSLGVVLFELLTGRLPYEVENSSPRKQLPISPSEKERQDLGDKLLQVLLRATSPDPSQRFQSAREFLDALSLAPRTTPEPVVPGSKIINPFVDDLRGAYRNSRTGNADNRGLDTDFANNTYVVTSLDTSLLPRLLETQYRLLVLSGNPGDGKTAFLQQVRTKLQEKGATPDHQDASGWQYRLGDWLYAALYDASESHEGKSADALLQDTLRPLEGDSPPSAKYTAAIAVNDGRLLDFFERYGAVRYPWLWSQLRSQLFEHKSEDPSIIVVDLKDRSLVTHNPDQPSTFSRILDTFVAPSRWECCEQCAARQYCPIRFNAQSFSDTDLSKDIRRQLHKLLLAVHLRRERRPTVRDLRSALAYLITNDLNCERIHAQNEADIPIVIPNRLYFMAAFDGSGAPDLLLDEWHYLDPSAVASPRLDRFLHFHRGEAQMASAHRFLSKAAQRTDLKLMPVDQDTWITFMKRAYFFEALREDDTTRTDEQIREELPNPDALLPYRHFSSFLDALVKQLDEQQLLQSLCEGISRSDGVPEHACEGCLALQATQGAGEDLTVVKRFPMNEFEIHRPKGTTNLMEEVPDHLILAHRGGAPALTIGLDLFEFIFRARNGYLSLAEEQRALVEDLNTFKNQLLARPTHDIILIEGGRRLHKVHLETAIIQREQAQS